MQLPDIRYWAGTEESFDAYVAAIKMASTLDIQAYSNASDEEDPPRLLSKQGDVAVVSIAGPLMPGEPRWARYVGVTGYGEIRAALVAAATDPSVGAIVLDINSGGGAVNGVTDVAELIAQIDKNVKPVHTFSDGAIASAAYWLGSSARRVDIGKVTEAGSLGVLTVHMERSRMLDAMGITATVMRAGEYKALGHPAEPLTPKAKTEIQGQLDHMYQMFLQHVADSRGVSYQVADTKMGQGRVFVGTRAVEAGLADSVTNFDALVSGIQGAIDSQKERSQYGANFQKGHVVKHALTEQQVAALAEGGVASTAASATTNGQSAEAAATAAKEAADRAEADKAAKAAADAAAAAATAATTEAKPTEVVALLQTQLSASQAQVVDLTVKVRDLSAAAEKLTPVMASFRAIVEASADRLKVALGGASGAVAGLSDDALLAMHTNLRGEFEKKFKAGGVAAVSSSASAEKSEEVATDEVRSRRIQATRLAK